MSVATHERSTVGADMGSDLASLVVAYHGRAHASENAADCVEKICRVASQCIDLDEMFFGVDV